MSIIGMQRRLHESGRVRLGTKEEIKTGPNAGKKKPVKLLSFRFTSQTRRHLEAVAQLYGGEVTAWADAPTEGQWELFTDATELDVVVPPQQVAFSQHYELWSGAVCRRRCDGQQLVPGGEPCVCNPEDRECKPTTRLSFMLARIPGIGLWRLESHGKVAAGELAGSIELAQMLGAVVGRDVLPGQLRVEEKVIRRPNPKDPAKVLTHRFPLAVLDFAVDMAALAAGGSPIAAPQLAAPTAAGELAAGPGPRAVTAVPAASRPSIADQVGAAGAPAEGRQRRSAPPPVARTGRRPRRQSEISAGSGRAPAEAGPAAGHGTQGDPAAPAEGHETASQPALTDEVEEAKAAALALLAPLDLAARRAWGETAHEEFGADEAAYTAETWRRVRVWFEENLPSAEELGVPAAAGDGDGGVPGFCRDLHAKRQAMGLAETRFRTLVRDVSGGRTDSTRELTAREAAALMRRLVDLEQRGAV